MPAKLTCKFGASKGTSFTLEDEAVIGRSKACHLVLRDRWVSSRHARIYWDQAKKNYMIEDLGSANGTQLDGLTISGPEPLERLHVINFGGGPDFFFQETKGIEGVKDTRSAQEGRRTFTGHDAIDLPAILAGGPPLEEDVGLTVDRQDEPENEPAEAEERDVRVTMGEQPVVLPSILTKKPDLPKIQEKPASPPAQFRLKVEEQPGEYKSYFLREGKNVIGRSLDASIRIPKGEISRQHAVITLSEGELWLKDEGSANATFLKGEKLTGPVQIKPGDAIQFSKVEAMVEIVQSRSEGEGES